MVKKFEDSRFDRMYERDRHTHTHRRTDRHRMTTYAALMHRIARQKCKKKKLMSVSPVQSLYHEGSLTSKEVKLNDRNQWRRVSQNLLK